jgi:hypothetical protein
MITQEEIDKAAEEYVTKTVVNENAKVYPGDLKEYTIIDFQAGVEWTLQQLSTVNRFEVIDHSKDLKGRFYVKRDCSVELQLQDNNKTLKVFVNDYALKTKEDDERNRI